MKEFFKKYWLYVLVVIVSLLAIMASICMHEYLHVKELYSHLVRDIGIAGLVAFGLSLTVERVSKKEFIHLANEQRDSFIEEFNKEVDKDREARQTLFNTMIEDEKNVIKRNVFEYVYGHGLPPAIIREIDAQILRSHFVRDTLNVKHTLLPYDKSQEFIKIITENRFIVRNLMMEEKIFEWSAMIESEPRPEFHGDAKFTKLIIQNESESVNLSEPELLQQSDRNKVPGHIVIPKNIKMKPGSSVEVICLMQTIMPKNNGYDIFISAPAPTMQLDLRVDVVDLNLIVHAYPFHRDNLIKDTDHQIHKNSYHWKLNSPVLPHQGCYLCWHIPPEEIKLLPPPEIPKQITNDS